MAITAVAKADGWSAGPFVHEFDLTLASGHRMEALGPLLSYERKESQVQWTLSPFLSHTFDPETDAEEFDFLYPLFTIDRFGAERRYQLFQLLSFSGGKDQEDTNTTRFSLFPFYLQQRSTDPNLNYTAVLPFYGHVQHRFFRDEMHWIMWPLYLQSRKQDVVTDNYLYPFFHVRHGDALKGWQFWPFYGTEVKGLTTKTNTLDDVITVWGHEKSFVVWPIYLNEALGLGSTNEDRTMTFLPFYSQQRSAARDSTSYLWPFFMMTDDRERQYREWDAPWPLVVFARGEGKTANRIWPLFGETHTDTQRSDFYFWPLYKYSQYNGTVLQSERTRIFFYLYSDLTDRATNRPTPMRRTDLWPLFTARLDPDGNQRLQLFAPLEPFLPNNKSIERNYSPVWSVWREEKNAKTGASSSSFLWNLYRQESTPTKKKCSLLFGLFQYQSGSAGQQYRFFYLPSGKGQPLAEGAKKR